MKIGLLLPSVYMGSRYKNKIFAPKELFLNLADGLADRGHEVYVYASPDTKTKAHLVAGEADLIKQDFISPKFRGLDKISKLKNAHVVTRFEYEIDLTAKAYLHAKEKKIDIMHSYHDFMAHYLNQLSPSVKTIYTIHDPRPLREHLEHWRFKHFRDDKYVFISKSQLRNFKGTVRSVGVVYHGINTEKFKFGQDGGEYLAFLGRYIKEKGVLEAIAAAKKTALPLKMIGDSAYRALPYYQNKVKPELKKGFIEDESFFGEGDRYAFLRNAKALLFPILWEEPFGLVMAESMACGTPVVAYNRGSVSEIVRDGLTGFIIDPDNEDRPGKGSWVIKKKGVEGLVEAIRRINSLSEEERRQMRKNCRARVEKNFTVEKMVANYERLYSNLIGK
ncbi:MAG: glycosyltransferase family 4 protein [Patescibacteria group bacterium]|nr:glycosyltransferase family 4 protein [Patescibacteria group bacterium]